MKNTENSESLPKKVLPRTLKGNPQTEKKRSVSINAIETTSKGANSKMEGERKHQKTTQSKIIQTEPQQEKKSQIVQTEVEKVKINLPTIQKNQNSRLVTLPQQSNSSHEFELQDYQKEFLLKMRAKAFIAKIKKEQEETQKKMMEMKEKERKFQEQKFHEIEEKNRELEQTEKERRREKVDHMVRQCLFNRQRRAEERNLRMNQHQKAEEKNLIIKQHQKQQKTQYNSSSALEERKQLNKYLKKRSPKVKTKRNQQKLLVIEHSQPEINIHHLSGKKFVPSKHKKQNSSKPSPQKRLAQSIQDQSSTRVPKGVRSCSQADLPTKLENHLYLTVEDEELLDKIQKNMIKLESLKKSDNVQNSKRFKPL